MISEFSQRRITNQHIGNRLLGGPEAVIAKLGAIQGQDYAGAKWSLALRLTNTTNHQIEEAFSHKKIVRTWLMRGTLHVVAADDVQWMLQLLAPRTIKALTARYRQLELDEQTMHRSNDILTKSLLDKRILDRKDLLSVLEQNGISTEGQRSAHLLQRASLDGLICQSNTNRNSPNYILLEELTHSHPKANREEALAELAKRYFVSRGPATIADFVWWSGLTVAEAKIGIAGAKSQLTEEVFDSKTYWMSDKDYIASPDESQIHLLPGFDEFLLGYKNRDFSLDAKYANKWCPGNNGMFMPYILLEGRVAGIWKRTVKKEALLIEINPFVPLGKKYNNDLKKAVDRYAKFMEMPIHEIIIK